MKILELKIWNEKFILEIAGESVNLKVEEKLSDMKNRRALWDNP